MILPRLRVCYSNHGFCDFLNIWDFYRVPKNANLLPKPGFYFKPFGRNHHQLGFLHACFMKIQKFASDHLVVLAFFFFFKKRRVQVIRVGNERAYELGSFTSLIFFNEFE